eukprot:scaffold160982_cov30-Attheya_sp.AAC.1
MDHFPWSVPPSSRSFLAPRSKSYLCTGTVVAQNSTGTDQSYRPYGRMFLWKKATKQATTAR